MDVVCLRGGRYFEIVSVVVVWGGEFGWLSSFLVHVVYCGDDAFHWFFVECGLGTM